MSGFAAPCGIGCPKLRKELLSITCVLPLRCALPQGDSINFKGDKFTTGNLLKTKVSLDFDGGRYERMVADTAGYVTVAKADKDNLFYLFATNLRAERFMKGKLNVYSPARFEVL